MNDRSRLVSDSSGYTSRRTAVFSIGNNNFGFNNDTDSENPRTVALEDSAVRALTEAINSIVEPNQRAPILGVKGDKVFETPTPFTNEMGMVNIHRPIFSQSKFSKLFGENIIERKPHRFFDSVFMPKSEERRCFDIFYSLFPLLNTIKTYNFKAHFPLDLSSGLTTGLMRIPQSMAYAILANMAPIYGLYTAFFSALLYPIFGGSNHMAAGAQGVVSLLIGGGVIKATNDEPTCNRTIFTKQQCRAEKEELELHIAITITCMVGLFQCFFGIFRFGFLTNYLSDPLIGGYTTAAACTVVVSQLPIMFGVTTHSHTGILNLFYLLKEFFENMDHTNYATLIISVLCFLILALIKYLNYRVIHKIKIPLPGELVVMLGTMLFSHFTDADSRWHVKIVGPVKSGFQHPRLPNLKHVGLSTIEASFSAAIVSFAIGYSISKRMALKHDYEINGNQEIFAFGFMNTIGSFFNCFAATASMSASSLHESLGGVSQIANLVASLLLLLALLFIGPYFKPTPECVLSMIILINLKSILFQFADLKVLWKVSKIDFLLWLVSFLAVILLDVDLGLLIGVVFSLLTIVFRTQWPYVCLLGRIPCTDIYKNTNLIADAEEVEGIKIFRFEGSLYFASAEHFRQSIQNEVGLNPTKILKAKREREVKLLKVKKLLEHDKKSDSDSAQKIMDTNIIDLNCKEIHHIIVDFSTCSFIDSVGVRTIIQVINDYRMADISIFLANVRASVLEMLSNSSFLYIVNSKHIFLSVHDAVLGALEDAKYTAERNYIITDATIKSATRCVSRIASDPDMSYSYRFSRSSRFSKKN